MDRVAVIGAGVAGLSAARTLQDELPEVRVDVLERSDRVGGLVETERTSEGFLIEHGPDSLVTHDAAGIDMARMLGLEDSFVTDSPAPRRAYMASGSDLLPLPPALLAMTPRTAIGLLASPRLTLHGKARFLMEPFVPRRGTSDDESVAGFFTRRFGQEMAEKLVDPMLRGIYATPTDDLSMHAAMPRLTALEKSSGSVALGVTLARLKRRSRLPGVVSFRSGMSELTDALAASVRGGIDLQTEVRSVTRSSGGRLRLETQNGKVREVDAMVVSTPAWAAARILRPLDEELASLLEQIEYAPHFSMAMAWPSDRVPHPMEGTGFLVSHDQDRFITACTWSSRKWPGVAPTGWELLRVFAADASIADEEGAERALGDLRDLMGITQRPTFVRIRRHQQLMPQRRVGHLDLVSRIESRAAQVGRIALAGNCLGTIGIPACIAGGISAAQHLRVAAGHTGG